MTASMAWPRFPLAKSRTQGAKQVAAPAELRTPNLHRAKESLLESANGSMATVADSAEENFSLRQRTKTHYDRKISLTPTGLLMEGDNT